MRSGASVCQERADRSGPVGAMTVRALASWRLIRAPPGAAAGRVRTHRGWPRCAAGRGRFDVVREGPVGGKRRHRFAKGGNDPPERRSGLPGGALLHAGRRRYPFNGEQTLQVAHHAMQTPRPVGGHRDMVLLTGPGRDRIDGAGVGEMAVLAHEGGSGYVGRHQPRMGAGVRREEGGQAEGQLRVHHDRDAPLRDGPRLGNAQGDLIGGERDRLRVKVAAGGDPAGLHQHERIVGHPVGLDAKRAGGLSKEVDARTEHLRLAADAIGVLHADVIVAMALADLRSGKERPRRRGGLALAPVTAESVDLGKERLGRSHDRIGRKGADRDGALGRPPGVEEGRECTRARELRPVEESQALLRTEGERRDSGRLERGPARHAAPFERGGPLADHHRREMRERRKVAGSADRSLDRYLRQDAAREHVFNAVDELQPDPRRATAEAEDLQGHHQPDVRIREAVAKPDAMRPDQVALQGLDLIGRNADPGELPEPRVHAVDGAVAPRALPEPFGRGRDGKPAARIDARRRAGAIDALELGEARFARMQRLGHCGRALRFMVDFRPRDWDYMYAHIVSPRKGMTMRDRRTPASTLASIPASIPAAVPVRA